MAKTVLVSPFVDGKLKGKSGSKDSKAPSKTKGGK